MYKTIKIGNIQTSKQELTDIAKSWIVLSLAFAFVFGGISFLSGNIVSFFSAHFLTIFIISALTAGLGFLLHELAHKITAQHYGCIAEFRAFNQMLYLALALAMVIGVIFAAPGAVMISGMITRKENGIISAAGPLTNYSLAMVFLGLQHLPQLPALSSAFAIGFSINVWLGLFNMIPFLNFDGKKIFNWSMPLWIIMVAFGIYFAFFL
ncbi:MAG: hypothetical protein AB1668_02645 [Nanoarchaeota archaeon]